MSNTSAPESEARIIRLCDHDVEYSLINAQSTFELHGANIQLASFVEENTDMPFQRNPKKFAAAFFRFSRTAHAQRQYMATQVDPYDVQPENGEWLQHMNSNVTALLFQEKVVITGARNQRSANLAANQLAEMLNDQTSLCVSVKNYAISNQVVGFAVPFCVDLDRLKQCPIIGNRVKYKPDKFPLATIQCYPGELPETVPGHFIDEPEDLPMPTSKRAALVSRDGPVIVTGAHSVDDALRYMRHIMPHLVCYMDTERARLLAQGKIPARRITTEDPREMTLALARVVGNTIYDDNPRYMHLTGKTVPLGAKRAYPGASVVPFRQIGPSTGTTINEDTEDDEISFLLMNLNNALETIFDGDQPEEGIPTSHDPRGCLPPVEQHELGLRSSDRPLKQRALGERPVLGVSLVD